VSAPIEAKEKWSFEIIIKKDRGKKSSKLSNGSKLVLKLRRFFIELN